MQDKPPSRFVEMSMCIGLPRATAWAFPTTAKRAHPLPARVFHTPSSTSWMPFETHDPFPFGSVSIPLIAPPTHAIPAPSPRPSGSRASDFPLSESGWTQLRHCDVAPWERLQHSRNLSSAGLFGAFDAISPVSIDRNGKALLTQSFLN